MKKNFCHTQVNRKVADISINYYIVVKMFFILALYFPFLIRPFYVKESFNAEEKKFLFLFYFNLHSRELVKERKKETQRIKVVKTG